MQSDKNYRDGAIFKAVNGLWFSGLYALWAGSGAGLVCGAAVGVLYPVVFLFLCLIGVTDITKYGKGELLLAWFMLVICGAIVGTMVGAVVGLLAGILGSGFGGRQGCRNGTAIAACFVGGGLILTIYYRLAGPHVAFWKNGTLNGMALLPWGLLLLFTALSYGVGNYMYTCLEKQEGSFMRWRITLHEHGVDELTKRERAIATVIASAPVLFTYGYIIASLLMRAPR